MFVMIEIRRHFVAGHDGAPMHSLPAFGVNNFKLFLLHFFFVCAEQVRSNSAVRLRLQ